MKERKREGEKERNREREKERKRERERGWERERERERERMSIFEYPDKHTPPTCQWLDPARLEEKQKKVNLKKKRRGK